MNSQSNYQLSKEEQELLLEWWTSARYSQHSHHNAAKLKRKLSWLVEGPTVIFPIAMGGVAVSSIGSTISDNWKLAIAILGALTALLTGAHLYFGFHEEANQHVSLGARYGNVRRRIQALLKIQACANPSVVDDVRRELDELAKEQPVVSTTVFQKTKKGLDDKGPHEFVTEIQGRLH